MIRYAGTVMEVYKVNEELNNQLKEVSLFTAQFTADSGNIKHNYLQHHLTLSAGPSLSMPEHIRENCKEESYEIVTKLNSAEELPGGLQGVQSPQLLALVASLSALMLQIKRVADGERNAAELQAIKESLLEIESSLHTDNTKVFQVRLKEYSPLATYKILTSGLSDGAHAAHPAGTQPDGQPDRLHVQHRGERGDGARRVLSVTCD